jgi:hypothetical protein
LEISSIQFFLITLQLNGLDFQTTLCEYPIVGISKLCFEKSPPKKMPHFKSIPITYQHLVCN